MNLTPVSAVCRNPLQGVRPADLVAVPLGTRIRDLEPKADGGLVVCRFNGEWLLREHWDEVVSVGDRLEWYEYPQGREGIRLLLTVATVIASIVPGFQAAVPYLLAASAAYNILVPPRVPEVRQLAAASGVYSASLAGNVARLDQPIWRNFGRVKITPPFAAQPYTEFLPIDSAEPDGETDQYYYAIFALGIGPHDVEKAFIGKTSIVHFKDILTAQYLAPGVQPTTALANVVSSDEVSAAIEMLEGLYTAGYAASRPNDLVTRIGIDIAVSQGLGIGVDPLTVEWQVEAREIDEFGRPIGLWQILGNESRTDATNTPQRWTKHYTLATPIRPEVRVVRTNLKNTDPNARDGLQWIGLRAYLQKDAPLNPDASHFEVVMRASDQLSSFSQRDFSMIVRALVRTWDPDTGWSSPVFTRNAMWWLADLWTNTVWGERLPDDRVDLQGLFDIAQTLDERQDRFDYSLTSGRDSWEVAQLIAHSARCRAFRRGGVHTIARDELVDVPVTAFTSRNTQPKSMVVHAALPRREQPDGVIVEYQYNVTWDTAVAECPCPGFSATDANSPFFDTDLPPMENPVYIALDGVTGRFHALREGIYQAASMAYRTSTVSAKAEMEGVIVAFMDPVRWQPLIRGYGQAGDVARWDDDTLVMELTEPATFGDDALFLTLQRDDGSLTTPVAVLPGPTANEVTLPDVPDFGVITRSGTRERTKYILGPLVGCDELVKISSISDGGKVDGAQMFDIEALIDDDRVHEADNSLLPGRGEIQDPIDDGTDYGDSDGPGTIAIPRLLDHAYIYGDNDFGVRTYLFEFTFEDDGTLSHEFTRNTDAVVVESGTYAHEWLAFPVEPDQVDDFEVLAHIEPSSISALYPGAFVGTFETWLPMSASHTFGMDSTTIALDVADQQITFFVRRIGTTVVQAEGTVSIRIGEIDSPGGGD